MTRFLRLAAAVFFVLLAIGFAALWVRSYTYRESVCGMLTELRFVGFYSDCGHTEFSTHVKTPDVARLLPLKFYRKPRYKPGPDWPLLFRWVFYFDGDPRSGFAVGLPHWFLAASSLGLAALFAFKRTWRYSLRTILVATTLLAVILGLAVYAG